jgi:Transglutaminase-like superfamily
LNAVRRLFRLSKSELGLLLEAAATVVAIRVALWLLPYDKLRAYLSRRLSISPRPQSTAIIVRFISTVSRFVPRATCLTQALAAELLLRRHGHDASLQIGVAKSASNDLLAHAWVESGGVIVIGGDEIDGLTTLRATMSHPRS